MGFSDFLKNFKREDSRGKKDTSTHWTKCVSCGALMYNKELLENSYTCSKCSYHFRISAQDRLGLICDKDTFCEYDTDLEPNDPLGFVDKKSYTKRIEEGYTKTKRKSAVISGETLINSIEVQLAIFDFAFMGGSLGSVEGEKIVRTINRAIVKKQAVIIIATSGGARMQESTYALMQMAKTSAALNKLAQAKLPYISVLTDPTFGGVSASFAFLGDIIIAEPGAMIGFAGARVIKQTIGADLPQGFQTSEFLLEHGLIDMIVSRKDLKKTLSDLVSILVPYENTHLYNS
ncbi:acetyl-CoA carboxylase carboxyl transferase subunit beta [Helicobacter didelphidarum]|uniref:Acetyl-coenzyme A carboxylase carboxyl transferase subunit beta n=1 Tax=Helicobacter didelphidarum TaxID=2040648 RepID=A0A3D8II71_9HELI|nr:acetyl-CoA carboxylase, carboxyltransferase subunit beta [Helicobacter didelphidarum]RDU64949.1 acetyl-CoA carboxylase carboxyl transferase subunit beta [Helicobacter didelphidarum]